MSANEKSQQKLAEITKKLEEGVKSVFSSEDYTEYLRIMSTFYHYSASNSLLIYLQRPDATAVGSYTHWRSLDRQVNKGEHGILIICPVSYRKEKEKIDPVTKQPVLDKNGNAVKEVAIVTRYKVGYTYDVSQTSGKPLPEIVHDLQGTVSEYDRLLEAIQDVSPVPISFEAVPGNAKGFYNFEENRIAIKAGMPQEQTIKTAIHEVAHSILDNKEAQAAQEQPVSRSEREIRAESVAYCVCCHLGIDTSDYSFGYVASWSRDKTAKDLLSCMDSIRTTAAEIIGKIDSRMQEQEQQREEVQPVEVYKETCQYAKEHGQTEQFKESLQLNVDCKKAIEEAIKSSYDGMHLSPECVQPVLEQYGADRVSYVLATTVQSKDWDSRFSPDNRKWAQGIRSVPDVDYFGSDRRWEYCVNTHSAVLDAFVSQVRQEIQVREKASVTKQPEQRQRKKGRHR